MPKYFEDLTIKEMFEHHDHTYMMADDHRAYENGSKQAKIIVDKVKSEGGWTKEMVDLYNKYAPEGMFQLDYDLIHKSLKSK